MDYLSGWCESKRRLDGHTVIVTGCNSGIGKETALDLYKKAGGSLMNDINYETKPYNSLEAYSRSKAANVIFAKALAQKLKEHNIENVTTYSLHPGVVTTAISRHLNDTAWLGATWLFDNVLGWFVKSPRCGAQTTIYCAVDEGCAKDSGLYYCECAPKHPSKFSQRSSTIKEFWNLTIEMLNLQSYNPFGYENPNLLLSTNPKEVCAFLEDSLETTATLGNRYQSRL